MADFAWVIFADGAVDQIVETEELALREADDLRAMGCDVWTFSCPWEQQDDAVRLCCEAYERAIVSCREKQRKLIAQHGEGVRPAWVSADLGHEDMWIRNYTDRINLMKENGDA